MQGLLRICALLLSLLVALVLRQGAGLERAAALEQSRGEVALQSEADAESQEDGASERSPVDDAADESALALVSAVASWPSTAAAPIWHGGLARGRPAGGAPFKPPRLGA